MRRFDHWRSIGGNPGSPRQSSRITRLRKRFQDIVSIDFFGCPLRVEQALSSLQASKTKSVTTEIANVSPAEYRNRVWVTRPRPGIDRVTSAWLIRNFIDPKAKFAFVPEDKKPAKTVPFNSSTCTKVALGTVVEQRAFRLLAKTPVGVFLLLGLEKLCRGCNGAIRHLGDSFLVCRRHSRYLHPAAS